jgi:hypothetical protein
MRRRIICYRSIRQTRTFCFHLNIRRIAVVINQTACAFDGREVKRPMRVSNCCAVFGGISTANQPGDRGSHRGAGSAGVRQHAWAATEDIKLVRPAE